VGGGILGRCGSVGRSGRAWGVTPGRARTVCQAEARPGIPPLWDQSPRPRGSPPLIGFRGGRKRGKKALRSWPSLVLPRHQASVWCACCRVEEIERSSALCGRPFCIYLGRYLRRPLRSGLPVPRRGWLQGCRLARTLGLTLARTREGPVCHNCPVLWGLTLAPCPQGTG
jgi:hypothetical protein